MRNRLGIVFWIALCAAVGYLVSRGWGMYYSGVFGTGLVDPTVDAIARLMQPVAALERRFNFYLSGMGVLEVARWNAATYALAGLAIERIWSLCRRRRTFA